MNKYNKFRRPNTGRYKSTIASRIRIDKVRLTEGLSALSEDYQPCSPHLKNTILGYCKENNIKVKYSGKDRTFYVTSEEDVKKLVLAYPISIQEFKLVINN